MEIAPSAMLSDDKSQLLGQVDSNAFLTHLLRLQHLQPVSYVGHFSVSCQSISAPLTVLCNLTVSFKTVGIWFHIQFSSPSDAHFQLRVHTLCSNTMTLYILFVFIRDDLC